MSTKRSHARESAGSSEMTVYCCAAGACGAARETKV